MKSALLIGVALTLLRSQGSAEDATATVSARTVEDVTVTISEETVNAFLAAVGPVSGKGKKKGVKFTWTVTEAEIAFEPGSAQFIAKIRLKAGRFKSSDVVTSRVSVTYDSESNRISMRVEEAIYKIYVKVLGKKIKVAQVDIAKYYRPRFEFNGPEPVQESVEVETGRNRIRVISVTPRNSRLSIETDMIRTTVDLVYSGSDKPGSE